jgi:hypothetical protein
MKKEMVFGNFKVAAGLWLTLCVLGTGAGFLPPKAAAEATAGSQQNLPAREDLDRLAAVIKPRPEENKWQRIPWITDVGEGRRLAVAEKRPICLVVIFGDLLDEC